MTLNKRDIAIVVVLGVMAHLLTYLSGLNVGAIVLMMGLAYFWYLYFREIKNGRAGEIRIFAFALSFAVIAVWIGVREVFDSNLVNLFFLLMVIAGANYVDKISPPPPTP